MFFIKPKNKVGGAFVVFIISGTADFALLLNFASLLLPIIIFLIMKDSFSCLFEIFKLWVCVPLALKINLLQAPTPVLVVRVAVLLLSMMALLLLLLVLLKEAVLESVVEGCELECNVILFEILTFRMFLLRRALFF